MPPIRVLQIMPAMDAGGMETFVMNVYRAVDRSQVQFDFLYHYDKPCFYDAEIEALGGHITKLTVRQDNNIPKYLHDLRAFFTAHPEYKVIHGHYSGFGMFYNAVARRCGVPVRAGHSHNTAYEHNLVGQLDRLMSSRFDHDLTHRFACSQRAGERANQRDEGRRLGAFEARRLHMGRQREVQRGCARTARATTRRRPAERHAR